MEDRLEATKSRGLNNFYLIIHNRQPSLIHKEKN